jgi:hypothetical protein
MGGTNEVTGRIGEEGMWKKEDEKRKEREE